MRRDHVEVLTAFVSLEAKVDRILEALLLFVPSGTTEGCQGALASVMHLAMTGQD